MIAFVSLGQLTRAPHTIYCHLSPIDIGIHSIDIHTNSVSMAIHVDSHNIHVGSSLIDCGIGSLERVL